MARFSVRKLHFGEPETDDDGDGLPRSALARLQAHRAAGIAEAKAVLAHLPKPGESLHALYTARMDLTDVITSARAVFDRLQIPVADNCIRNQLASGRTGRLTAPELGRKVVLRLLRLRQAVVVGG
jgi:hypothetical protein